MSAATPFPAMAPGAPSLGYVTEQGEVVPGWYVRNQHTDMELVVKQNGVPLIPTIKVGMVAPSRRWAIGLDGNLMDQVQFEQKVRQKNEEYYAICRAEGRNAKPGTGYRFERDYGPNVLQYVQWKVNPKDPTKLIEIHYDPEATKGARPDHFVNKDGEKVEGKKIDHLCAAFADPALRGKLRPEEIAEVQAYLGLPASSGAEGLQAKLEQLTEMHDAGEITDDVYMKKVAALSGVSPSEPMAEASAEPQADAQERQAAPAKPKRTAPRIVMPCGQEIYQVHKRHHLKKCQGAACVAAREDTS